MITHKIEGDKQVLSTLKRISSPELRRKILDEVGSYGVFSTQQRFLDEKDPDGNKWKPSHRAKTEGGSTLRKNKYLFDSLAHFATSDSVEWGSNRIYAAIQHLGGIIKPKKSKTLRFVLGGRVFYSKKVEIPARPYLGINDDDRSEIQSIIRDHFLTEVTP